MLKKITAALLPLIIILTAMCACTETKDNTDKLKIVCTVFPYYDWAKNITEGSENTELILLLDNGTDPHSFQPSAEDIVTISTADIFIYTGGESDSWVEDVLKTSENEDTLVLKLMDCLESDRLYCVEENNEDNLHSHKDTDDSVHTPDEHIWLSLKNAAELTGIIADAIIGKDSKNKALYEENCKNYKEDLLLLNSTYERTFFSLTKDTIVVADRFPFIYLVNDYGIKYHAAFPGCSAESEASFETVTRLTVQTDKLGLSSIIITETSDGALAESVKNNTETRNQQILTLNSIQSVTSNELTNSYIDIMNTNLSVLEAALS